MTDEPVPRRAATRRGMADESPPSRGRAGHTALFSVPRIGSMARLALLLVAVAVLAASSGVGRSVPIGSTPVLVLRSTIPQRDGHAARIEVYAAPDAGRRARPAFLTLGGPVYCGQILALARYLDASLLCADYWRNGDTGPGLRDKRFMDWGDPSYHAAVAKLPARAGRAGVRISKLIVIGVSYSGYAAAQLVATHPDLRPAALIVVDSYLDLGARFHASKPWGITRKEITAALGGTPAGRRAAYDARSPSHHLGGLATAIRIGMRFVDVWSVHPFERKRYVGATCSRRASAQWLSQLATHLDRPVDGFVTRLQHAEALWYEYRGLLALAGLAADNGRPLAARRFTFRPGTPPSVASFCADQVHRSPDGVLYGQVPRSETDPPKTRE